MAKSGRFILSPFVQLLRLTIVTIFIIGLLPVPALAQADGIIAGYVSDNTTGDPIPGAMIIVFEPGSPEPGWTGNTGASGNYSIPTAEGNNYEVAADKVGYITGHVSGQSVTANATTTVNFSLVPGGIIQGAVTDNSTHNGIPGSNVRAYRPETPGAMFYSPSTDASGHFSLTAPPGTGYTVEVNSPGYGSANQTGVSAVVGSPVTIDFALVPSPAQDTTPPATVNDLAAGSPTPDSITLTWTAPGDDGATGQASQYEIRQDTSSINDETAWNNAIPVPEPPLPQPAGATENFTLSGLSDNTTYFFALKTRDEANHWSGLSNSPSAKTSAAPPVPGFTITHGGGIFSFMLGAGDNITETFDIASVNNFTGTVSLILHGPPEIEGYSSLSPDQVTLAAGETRSVSLNLGASTMTPSGSYQCGLSGQTNAYGGQQREAFFSVTIGVAGQPLLSASPPVVAAGTETNFFASQFVPAENVTLEWDSGPRAGQILASGQIDQAGTWNVPVSIPPDMPGGNFAVRARSESCSALFQLTITSGSGPDFIISASPQFVSIPPGNSGNVTIYVKSINGFQAPVALSSGSPPEVNCNLSANTLTPGAGETVSAMLTITVAEWASPSMLYINVEGAGNDPPITKMVDISLDIPPLAEWGPSISLSPSHGQAGNDITVTGTNFPGQCNGEDVVIREVFSDTMLPTTPASITVNNGSFTGTFTVPQGVPSGNYRIEARVPTRGVFTERDFQILGTGETFTLGASPQSVTVTTEPGSNSASASLNIVSVGGSSPSVNLEIEGSFPWLEYRFGSLPANTPASGENAISVPAGGTSSRNLSLTANMTAPSGTYSITIRGWVTGSTEQRVSLILNVQPPAGFGMAQLTLSPTFGPNGRNVNLSGFGFTDCNPGQVTELYFGPLDILTGQGLPAINVPQEGSSAGKFSGSFRIPAVLPPGTYPVKVRVGAPPYDKLVMKPFTITGTGDTFVLQASPTFLWAEQGRQISTMIKVQSVGSASANVSLAVEGCPPDITASFVSGNVTAPPGGVASTDLNLTIKDWIPAGHYTITVRGQRAGGAEVHRTPLEIDVVPPSGFGMASIYLNPTVGSPGTWITISGSGFPADTDMTHLFFGPPNPENDRVASLPAITTDGTGALSAVLQVPAGLNPGMYPVELVVGTPSLDKRAIVDFTLVSDQASFNINLSPIMIQTAPGTSFSTSVNVQAFGALSTNVTLRVDGPPTIQWRFDGGEWQTPTTVIPSIGGTIMSSLEIQPKASTSMGHYSLAVKASAGAQQEMRNLELDVGASAAYGMPIFSLNPNTGTAGTNLSFSGSNFPADARVLDINFGGDNITLAQTITTSPQGSFSGSFTIPATVGGQPLTPGSYMVRVTVATNTRADVNFNVYGSDDTFSLNLSPNFLQGEPGGQPVTSGLLKALGGATPTVKMAVRGLPPGVTTRWNGTPQPVYTLGAPPGGQNNFDLALELPGMIPMGHYPAVLEGWVDSINQNGLWDNGEKVVRVNLELSVMPPQGYGMGMLSLTPTYGQVGDTITFAGSGFTANTTVQSLTFANTSVLAQAITTSDDGSFSGLFTVPATAFNMDTGPGIYPIDVTVGTFPNDQMGHFEFQVISAEQKFSVSASPHWLARPAGDTGYVNINVRSLVTTPPSPNIVLRIEGLPRGVNTGFTSANVTPPVGGMESRDLQLTISDSCQPGNYPISIRAYNTASPAEEIWTDFTLEVTPSSDFMDMGMATLTISPTFGAAGDQITVSGYGFPKNENLTFIHLGPENITPSVATTTDATGAFSAVITVPALNSGTHPLEVNVQNIIRMIPFNIMSENDTFSLKISPMWLEPVPAGDPNGREIAITVAALAGKTPSVHLSTEGLFAAFGTIEEVWNPVSQSVNVTGAGGSATAVLILKPSETIPPGPYPFTIVGVDGNDNRREFHMELQVGPPGNFMGGLMGMDQGDWNQQWQGTEWENGVFFPEVILSPRSGPAGTQVSYTGTNLPAGANVTSINFAGQSLPLPAGGLTVDDSGGFSGSFIVNEAWSFTPGMYGIEFHAQNTDGWSQHIVQDFNLMRGNASFSLEANPAWIPPIPPGSFGQTRVTAKALGYDSTNVTLAVVESFGSGYIPGGAQAHWGTTDGPGTANITIPAAGQTSRNFYLRGDDTGHYMITIVGWIDSNNNQILEPDILSEAESAFMVPLDFEIEPPEEYKNWDKAAMMSEMNMDNDDMYLFYFPEITLNPNIGQVDTKVNIKATDFPANAAVTLLRFAGMDLPVPTGTSADSNGNFTLVFNVPRTIWGGNTSSGWYDIEVEAQKPGEPPVHIMKPFQVTASDVSFTLKADPDWLPPIPPDGNGSTLIRIRSMGSAVSVNLTVDKIPPGVNVAFSPGSTVNVPPGGSGSATLTLTPVNIPPGRYHAEIRGTAGPAEFFTHLEFEVQPPPEFMNWNKDAMMSQMNMASDDMYLFYFPEITLNPNVGQAGTKVTIGATDFPAGANVTSLMFAGMQLPIPAGTAADANGDFTLVFNVPKTIWGGNTASGWYDIEVEARKPGEPPVFIMKPFQVTAADVAFTLRADPNWLPPIPPNGNGNTSILINSMGAGFSINLSVDRIPPGINTAFSSSQVNVPPGGSGSATLTLTPVNIPPGHYSAEIKGTAIVNSAEKSFYTHLEFEVQPPPEFMDVDWMAQQGIWFPEITLNPNAGPVKTKVSVKATDFPAGAEISHLRFAGRELPVPAGTTADSNGDLTLVFNVPADFGIGNYMVEVEARKTGMPPVFIAKPFFIEDPGVSFKLNAVPGFIPGVPQGDSGNTTILVEATGQAVTVNLYVDGLPPGVTATFDSSSLNVAPGGSGSTRLTINTRASTGPGHYPLTIRGVSGSEVRMVPFGFGVTPPTAFQVPEFTLEPDFAPAGYSDKQYKVTFSGTGFPPNQSVSSLIFGAQPVAIPENLATGVNGNFTGVFLMPTGLTPGTYDVRVAVADGRGGYIYDSRPFSVQGADARFILKPSPPYLPPIVQGGQGTTIVNVRSVGTTSANVTLSVEGLAPGISAAFTPNSTVNVAPGGSAGAMLTINVSASTPPGPYPLSIRGASGNETATVPLGFGVMPDIGGGEGHATITINPSQARPGEHISLSGAGFTTGNTVTLTAAPPGAPVPIDITPGTILVQNDGTWATEITIPEAGQVPPGTYIIKASDGVMASKNTFSIVPATDADFFLNVSPQFIEVAQGASGNTTMTLSSKNGFQENIVFSVGHLAPGVTATFKDSTGTTISQFAGTPGGIREVLAPIEQTPVPGEDMVITVLINVDTATPIGLYDIGLEAGSGTVYRSVPLGLMVNCPGANLAISPMSGPADTDIRLSGSGFTAGETVNVTFAGTSITTIPGTIIASRDGTFTAVITAPSTSAGIHPISATGATSGITVNRPFVLKPSAVNTFVLYASPMKVDIPKGASGTITAKIEPSGSFQSPVALTVSGLSAIAGATANLSPSSTVTPSIATPTTTTLTINVPSGATEGKYPLVITATSGSITQTRRITVKVVPPAGTADFAISLAPNTVPIGPGSTGNTTVTVTAINGFAGTVNLAVAMSDPAAAWPSGISYTTANITPSAVTGLGKQAVTLTMSADMQPGIWAIKITGANGALERDTEVMVVCTPSGTALTPCPSPRVDPTTITPSTPVDMAPPWGDKIIINGLINDGSEPSVITPTKVDVPPDTLASLPEGASDILGRVTNVESDAPVDGVEWDLGFPFDPAVLEAAGLDEENLKIAYLDPETGEWTEVTTTVDTENKMAYASPDHFSSWTLIATPAPPPSRIVSGAPVGGGGGGGGAAGITNVSQSRTGTGRFVEDVTAKSADGKVRLDIPKNTVGLNRNGQPINSLSLKPQAAPSAPPAGSQIIGAVYNIGPSGTYFDPPVNLTFTYDETRIHSGATEDNLFIATWDGEKWVELPGSTVDPGSNTITAPVSHFTIFTVMAYTAPAAFEISAFDISPAVISPGESTTISVSVTNTGDIAGSYEVTLLINEGMTAAKEISLGGHASQRLTFTVAPQNAGSYAVDVNGITGTFIVKEAPVEPEGAPEPAPSEATSPLEIPPEVPEEVTSETEITIPSETPAVPSEITPSVTTTSPTATAQPATSSMSLWLMVGIAAGLILISIGVWQLVIRRKVF